MNVGLRSVPAIALLLAAAVLFAPSPTSATDEIVYYCAITSSSSYTAPTSGTVLASCPAIPANTIQAGDSFEWEMEAEENAHSSGGGTTGYKFFLSSNDMIGVNNGCQSSLGNNSSVFDFTYRGWDTVDTNGTGATSILAYECLVNDNGIIPRDGDNNPGFDTTVSLTPKIVAGVNFPTGSTTQVYTFIVKLIR